MDHPFDVRDILWTHTTRAGFNFGMMLFAVSTRARLPEPLFPNTEVLAVAGEQEAAFEALLEARVTMFPGMVC